MRTKRFLLVTAALSTVACGKDPARKPEVSDASDAGETLPFPANPKGTFYDGGMTPPPPPPPPIRDAEAPKEAGSGPIKHHLPANPKGSHYDAGKKKFDFGQ